ncbi:MAG TPA: transglutaminase, partial [Terracidiphilus sp.]
IKAYYLHVDTRRGYIDPTAPSLYGNHMITAIELPAGENDARLAARVKTPQGKTLLIFDPTDEWTPVGLIRGELQGAYGNLADGENSQIIEMPVLAASSGGVAREGKFALAEDGSLSGELDERRTGDDAQRERISIKYSDAKELREEIERRVGADLPGLTFKDYQFASVTDLDKPLDLTMKISAANYAHSAGPLLLLRPRVLGSHVHAVPDVMDGKPRLYPIVLGHPGTWKDSFDITLPAGYAVDDTPEPVSVDVEFASYKSTVTAKGSTLHYESEYVVRDVEIPPAKAAEFRKLEQAILASEKGAAVLKKQ